VFATVVVPVVSVALLASVVGLPLGLALLLALAFAGLVGFVVAALALGRRLVPGRSGVLAFLVGWAILRLIGSIPVVSGIVFAAAAVVGVGGIVVATWRTRGRGRGGKHRPGRVVREVDREPVVDVVEEETASGLA
jgi:hypothetical protein